MEEMKEFTRIGQELAKKKETVRGLSSKLNQIITNINSNDICNELIELCLVTEVDCMPLICSSFEREEQCREECKTILAASQGGSLPSRKDSMEEFKKIGRELRKKKKEEEWVSSTLSNIIETMSLGSNDNRCEKLIKLCLQAGVSCGALIAIEGEDNTKQCTIVLGYAIGED